MAVTGKGQRSREADAKAEPNLYLSFDHCVQLLAFVNVLGIEYCSLNRPMYAHIVIAAQRAHIGGGQTPLKVYVGGVQAGTAQLLADTPPEWLRTLCYQYRIDYATTLVDIESEKAFVAHSIDTD